MLYVVAAFLAVLTFAFLVYAAAAGRGQARRGWHGCLPAFSCCYACCFGLGDDRPPLPAALVLYMRRVAVDVAEGKGTTFPITLLGRADEVIE